MHKKSLLLAMLLIASTLLLSFQPTTTAWVYPDCTEDTNYERFGPRLDRLLINLYATADAEFDALAACEIDMTDWPLTPWYAEMFNEPPYNETIKTVYYGPDLDEIVLEINNNATLPDGSPNPGSVSSFRHALAHLIDRLYLIEVCDWGRGIPMYTEVWPGSPEWVHPEIRPGGLLEDLTHPYDRLEAARLLDADGFLCCDPDGYRYWDRNGNGEYDPGEEFELDFVIPINDPKKECMGSLIADEIEAPPVSIRVNRIFMDETGCWLRVMMEKYFHLYLANRNLRKYPDYLYNYKHSQMYWHPGVCPNYINFQDEEYDYWAETFKFANTYEEALGAAYMCQEVYATPCKIGSIPIECREGVKAMKRCYTGTPHVEDCEDVYECQSWKGIVNGYWDKDSCGSAAGINSWWTFLNAYPEGHLMGDCECMTMRYGFMVPDLRMLNPIYASSYWDWEVMNKIYDTLIRIDPYHGPPQEIPWMAKNWTVGTWVDIETGATYSKVRFTLRTDVCWHDGYRLTVEDVEFTVRDLPRALDELGCPPPWWHQKVKFVRDCRILDPCNIEILFNVKSIWVLDWIGTLKILPKHIWRPLIDSVRQGIHTCSDLMGFSPDYYLIGSGPWRLVGYQPWINVMLVSNKPSIILTEPYGTDYTFADVHPFPPGTPVHSHCGYFQWCPVYVDIHTIYTDPDPTNLGWWMMGDVNADGVIDTRDAAIIAFNFGWTGPPCGHQADINCDGRVDGKDLDICAENFGLDIWTYCPDASYRQRVAPCCSVRFRLTQHCLWKNKIPNTAEGEDTGMLIVNKVVKLEIHEGGGVIFPPGQWLHFQEPTEVHIDTPIMIHFNTPGEIIVDGVPIFVEPCQSIVFEPCQQVLFPPCMEVNVEETGQLTFKHDVKVGIKEEHDKPLYYCDPDIEILGPFHFKRCNYKLIVFVHIKGPEWVVVTKDGGLIEVPNPWVCQEIIVPYTFWSTITEDITGATLEDEPDICVRYDEYTRAQLSIPDCLVDISDIAKAARAYGSVPADHGPPGPRWDKYADINNDYIIDISDIAQIARKFGWGA